MIPKKPNDRHNPDNYRPISITNTLSKISEKLIKNRLVYYLESNKLITDFQSGFRSNKSTIDNLSTSSKNASKPSPSKELST
jgi:potassium voltage-gated channel Eag-related subfamily H protein 8